MLEAAADGVVAVAADGRIVFWNHAAEKILGYSKRDALSRRCWGILPGLDDKGNRLCYAGCQIINLLGMGEAVQNFDMQVRSKSGACLWLNVSILTLPNSEDNSPVAIHVFRDVSQSRELVTLIREGLGAHKPCYDRLEELTRREVEVLRLMATGLKTSSMADRLHISPNTVRNHVQNVLQKLDVHSRLEAVALAMECRLL